jgi:hypothetical protein
MVLYGGGGGGDNDDNDDDDDDFQMCNHIITLVTLITLMVEVFIGLAAFLHPFFGTRPRSLLVPCQA